MSNKSMYHLNCEKCGAAYWSETAFPQPQLCAKCSEPAPAKPVKDPLFCPQHGYPLPCAKCGHYGDETPETHYLPSKSDEVLRESVAKIIWETGASYFTGDEVDASVDNILALISAHNKDKAPHQQIVKELFAEIETLIYPMSATQAKKWKTIKSKYGG